MSASPSPRPSTSASVAADQHPSAPASTVVYVHAHPDDEASQTSGTMARLVATGHRVVVVYATNGDHGEVPDDLGDEPLVAYRRREAEASARVIGTHRVAWLDYADSGMSGWDQNDHEHSFHQAPVDEAAGRLAAILDEEDADVVVGYDWHGGYGHPDHVKVHHVVCRAVELATRSPRHLESTMNRDHMRRLFEMARELGYAGPPAADAPAAGPAGDAPASVPEGESAGDVPVPAVGDEAGWDPDQPMDDGNPLGEPEVNIHFRVDVRGQLATKRAALACHRSQKSDIEGFLSMPEEVFAAGFGDEWLIEPGREPGLSDAWPF